MSAVFLGQQSNLTHVLLIIEQYICTYGPRKEEVDKKMKVHSTMCQSLYQLTFFSCFLFCVCYVFFGGGIMLFIHIYSCCIFYILYI